MHDLLNPANFTTWKLADSISELRWAASVPEFRRFRYLRWRLLGDQSSLVSIWPEGGQPLRDHLRLKSVDIAVVVLQSFYFRHLITRRWRRDWCLQSWAGCDRRKLRHKGLRFFIRSTRPFVARITSAHPSILRRIPLVIVIVIIIVKIRIKSSWQLDNTEKILWSQQPVNSLYR